MLLVCTTGRGHVAARGVLLHGLHGLTGRVQVATDVIIRHKEGEDVPTVFEPQPFEDDVFGAALRALVGRLMLEDDFLLVRDAGTDDVALRADALCNDYRF
jgi:hypothetical protein